VFLVYGAPEVLLSGQGVRFTSELLECLSQLFTTHHVFSSGYRPQTAGLVERLNRTLLDTLAKFVETHQRDWGVYLPCVLYAYRTSYNPTVGNTPFYLVFGFEPRSPEDFFKLPASAGELFSEGERNRVAQRLNEARAAARATTDTAKERARLAYDRAHRKPVGFQPGDLVTVLAPRVPPSGRNSEASRLVSRSTPGGAAATTWTDCFSG
jgi:hypothetical protein